NRKKRIQPTLVVVRHFFRSKIGRYVQGPPPPPPTSQREDAIYKQVLNKIGFVGAIEELIELEREFQPAANRVELLEKINQDWDLDIAGKWKP
ncbi:MAG TPA: hypothetical protein VFQ23_22235, partial [Anaerolineales bacterium]|nr:hypothetical protein [Anaerolineales bacterium]